MMRLSPQHRDLISVILLLAILVVAFPLLGSWFGDRITPPKKPTPAATAPAIPTPTPEPTKESRTRPIQIPRVIRDDTPLLERIVPSERSDANCPMNDRAPLIAVLCLRD
jgi:hypothetical protein